MQTTLLTSTHTPRHDQRWAGDYPNAHNLKADLPDQGREGQPGRQLRPSPLLVLSQHCKVIAHAGSEGLEGQCALQWEGGRTGTVVSVGSQGARIFICVAAVYNSAVTISEERC